MPASRPDRAGDPELAAALGGEHHEDQEDQEDPGGDRERAERGEEGHERAPSLVGGLDRVLLDRLQLEVVRPKGRLELPVDGVGERDGIGAGAAVGDHHAEHLAVPREEELRLLEWDEQRRVRGRGTVELDDVPHPQDGTAAGRIRDHGVARAHAELVGGVGVQVRLARAQVGERHVSSVGPDDRREAVHPGRVGAEQCDRRLALPRPGRLNRHVVDDHVDHAVREVGAQRRLDLAGDRLGEPADAARVAEIAGDVVHGALGRDDLVRLAERRGRGGSDRVAHRVAGDERGRDDRRAEHEPQHDEARPRAPAAEVAHSEPDEHGVSDGEHGEDPERHPEPDREDQEQGVERDAEELVHDATVTCGISAYATR